jgi:3-oxoacyl-[acyl-carrier protein] reductase
MERHIVVTGATGGLGRAIVTKALGSGAWVTAVDIDGVGLQTLRRAHGSAPNLAVVQGDVANEDDCIRIVKEAVIASRKSVDVLVNNAGTITRSSTEDTAISDWERVIATNLTGTFLMTRACIPQLSRDGGELEPYGRIINIASRASERPHQNSAPSYGAAKAAVVYLTRHWSVELISKRILAFCISPGPVRTPMFDALDESYRRKIESEMITGVAIDPEEIADLVWYTATDCGPSMTGQTFRCNSGSYWG